MITNMIDSVYTSKHVVAILSHNYMSSSFCQEELSIASCKSKKEKEPSLIVIRIDNICRKRIPKILRKKTFLDYIDKEEQKTWEKRLIKHLKLKSMKRTVRVSVNTSCGTLSTVAEESFPSQSFPLNTIV